MSDYILSATLELKDKLTSKLSDSKKALEGVKASASGVSGALDTVQASMDKTSQSAAKATSGAEKLKSSLQGVKGNYSATLSVKDMASSGLSKVKSGLQSVRGKTAAASVHLRDEASAGIAHIKEGLTSLTGKTYTAMVNVKQNTGGITGLTEKAGNAVSGVASGMLMNTSMQMAGAAGIGFGIYDAIKSYADFEKEMSAVKAISGATGAEFDMLTEKARQMGADTKFSATESAQAFEYMAMAGWKTDDMMNGIEGVMNLAAASGEDLGRVSDIVTDALTAFGLKASDSAHFADVLAAAATSSNTNVGMMGETFKYVAPLAGALKYDVEDVATAIGVMANSGVKASEAGTSLRSIFTRLAKPPKDAAKALDALGISIKNSDGTIKPFMQTMEEMRDKFSGLTDDQKVQYAASIAGQEAMSGLLAIMNASEDDFEKVANAIDHANGSAEKMAKTRMDNLAGDIELVGGAWDQFVQTIMKGGTASGLRSIVQEIGSIMDLLNTRIKDGLDFGDVFAIAGKGITDLKNKFLQLDGVGSILAGGALAMGLYKIVGLTKKASSALKDIFSAKKGGKGGSGEGTYATRDMVVHATNVVVNGKNAPGGSVPGDRPTSPGKNTPVPVPPRGWRSIAKEAAAGGAIAAILSGLDIYSTHQENQEKLAEAAYGLASATDNLEQLQQSGASEEQISAAQQQVAEAKQYQADTQSNADLAIDKSISSGILGILGAGIGGVLMGPAGAAAMGFLATEFGDKLGEVFHNMASASAEDYAEMVHPENKMDDYDAAGMGEEPEMQMQLTAPDDDTVAQAVQDTEDKIASVSLTDLDDNSGTGLWESLFGGASAAGDEAQAAVIAADDGISEDVAETSSEVTSYADEAGDGIMTAYSGAETGTEAAWSPTAGWFSGSVFGPTSLGASECGSSMTQYFSASASSSQAAWSGVGGFFSGLFASIKSEAASCAASVAASMASAAEAARAGGHTTIAAGLDAVGNTAAWLGGVDYPHSASGTSFAPGGWTEINEHGGEIVDLPTGARVYPHATTMRMLDDLFSGDSYRPTMSATPLSIEVTPSAPSSNPAPTINITGNSFLVREEADIDKIAYKLMQLMQQANANMNYVGEGAFV
ncbi:phage tail tape measure protein [uncultured Mitsuokella sp.]|uniref:phage tail tape measure protein n=1 Tax=uncultured Mitsuokella sp. TaxID=453120 RepID=UPI00259A6C56|nr:phage tail tape measure protein [uncultured Mitsuokella sp.]